MLARRPAGRPSMRRGSASTRGSSRVAATPPGPYLGQGGDAGDPPISPLRARQLEGPPPACIHTAECDPLRDEGAAYADRLERAGVRVSYRCHPGMIHLFYGLQALIPYAATA